METTLLILYVILGISFLALFVIQYLMKRNHRVCDFRKDVLKQSSEKYKKLPSYEKMLFSIKPLKDKHWIK